MSSIGPSRLDDRRTDGDVFVLDIRPEQDYRENHIPGSTNAPVYEELQRGNLDALDPHLSGLPDDTEIVTVCKAGVVARKATTRLQEAGYTATTLTGGYAGWRQYEQNTVLYRVLSALRTLGR
ncbi:rhodanese-like domain-containing protein [Salarchaeum sp. JOR-1]|uniref:rhodanese-like domain-containing protein n=1 Tax=Salarchaeum sp. JOR-1 TaxID=2599399 RepID=UPI00119848A3|nr:rhodanese-like domain-containing protein [Salarchaeum sp. JOR-1]QDX39401.1 rhodanese-like domain-containing protein [Salarchaeum sp. JOR-1]